MRLIDELFTAHPFFGSRQIRDSLRLKGTFLSRKRIQRLMRIMGLVSVAPKPNTSAQAKGHKVYPYLLKNKAVTRPNQVWCTDITYIRLEKGFVYLVAVMDWYSWAVLNWELSVTMDDSF
ncbi:MAG: IS3 family transposase, partial [SAR324 cluster bacterium]|nr:IS3 family transposase [SAR324 cluster bacterium]